MNNIKLITEEFGAEISFLASSHFVVKQGGITIDSAKLVADPLGRKMVKAGTVMARSLDNDKYIPFTDAAHDLGSIAMTNADIGFLAQDADCTDGDSVCGLIIKGSVKRERVTGMTAKAEAKLTNFIIQ